MHASNFPVVEIEPLTDLEVRVLEFEKQQWRYQGAKEQAIKDVFDLSGHLYAQLLTNLIDKPAALVAEPSLVKRLRRLRTQRQKARSARQLQR